MKVINSFIDHFMKRYEACQDFGELHALNNEVQHFLMVLECQDHEEYKMIFDEIKEKAEQAKLRIFFNHTYF